MLTTFPKVTDGGTDAVDQLAISSLPWASNPTSFGCCLYAGLVLKTHCPDHSPSSVLSVINPHYRVAKQRPSSSLKAERVIKGMLGAQQEQCLCPQALQIPDIPEYGKLVKGEDEGGPRVDLA